MFKSTAHSVQKGYILLHFLRSLLSFAIRESEKLTHRFTVFNFHGENTFKSYSHFAFLSNSHMNRCAFHVNVKFFFAFVFCTRSSFELLKQAVFLLYKALFNAMLCKHMFIIGSIMLSFRTRLSRTGQRKEKITQRNASWYGACGFRCTSVQKSIFTAIMLKLQTFLECLKKFPP